MYFARKKIRLERRILFNQFFPVFIIHLEQVYAVRIPAGTVLGYQGEMYLGGIETEQVFIQEPWKISGVTIMKYPK